MYLDERPVLEFNKQRYEICITAYSWNSGNIHTCDFMASPLQEDKPNTGNAIWDAGNFELSIQDICELAGVDDLSALEQQAIDLID